MIHAGHLQVRWNHGSENDGLLKMDGHSTIQWNHQNLRLVPICYEPFKIGASNLHMTSSICLIERMLFSVQLKRLVMWDTYIRFLILIE